MATSSELRRPLLLVLQLLVLPCLFSTGVDGLSMANNVTEHVMVVENGTVSELILDCPYELDEDDENGLVVKWFIDDSAHAMFQWIPTGNISHPQLAGMDDVIDVTYEVSDTPSMKHRALRLVSPTPALSGLYRCEASSYFGEANFETRVVVYSLPSSLTLSVEELSPGGNVSISCQSGEAAPEPVLELFSSAVGSDVEEELPYDTTIDNFEGAYNVTVEATLLPSDLPSDTTVICRFTLPHTDLLLQEQIRITPDGEVMAEEEVTEVEQTDDDLDTEEDHPEEQNEEEQDEEEQIEVEEEQDEEEQSDDDNGDDEDLPPPSVVIGASTHRKEAPDSGCEVFRPCLAVITTAFMWLLL